MRIESPNNENLIENDSSLEGNTETLKPEDDKEKKDREEKEQFISDFEKSQQEIKSRISEIDETIDILFSGFSFDLSKTEPLKSLEEVTLKIESLKTITDPISRLKESSSVLLSLRKLEDPVKSDRYEKEQKINEIKAQIDRIDEYLSLVGQMGTIERAKQFFKVRNYKQDRKKLHIARVRTENDYGKDDVYYQEIHNKRKELEQKILEIGEHQITDSWNKDVSESIDRSWDKIKNNPAISRDIAKTYIENVIQPEIEAKPGDEESKKELLLALRQYIDEPEYNPQLAGRIREIASRNNHNLLSYPVNVILDEGEKKIFKQLFLSQTNELIKASLKRFQQKKNHTSTTISSNSTYTIEKALEKFPKGASFEDGDIILSGQSIRRHPNQSLWNILRKSPLTNSIFSGTIERVDDEIYQSSLVNALEDPQGSWIHKLEEYPTPESVRTIFMLAAAKAESSKEAVEAANWVLYRWCEQKDWPNILDKAEASYPELREVRPILENWKHRDKSRNPEIINTPKNILIPAIKAVEEHKDTKDLKLACLAMEGLSYSQIIEEELDILVPPEERAILKEARQILTESPDINSVYLDKTAHDVLINFFRRKNSNGWLGLPSDSGENLSFQLILSLSKKILENQDNYSGLQYLTSSGLVINRAFEMIKRKTAGFSYDLDLFLDAHKNLPEISKSLPVLQKFCLQFKDQETINFYRKMLDAYKEATNFPLETLLQLVDDKKINQERALELSRPIKTKNGEIDFTKLENVEEAMRVPHMYLTTNNGLEFFVSTRKTGIDKIDSSLEPSMGNQLMNLEKGDQNYLSNFRHTIIEETINKFLSGNFDGTVTEENWKGALLAYIKLNEENLAENESTDKNIELLKSAFLGSEAKKVCLEQIKSLWLTYLDSGKIEDLPLSLNLISEYIKKEGGAGPLSQIESLGLFCSNFYEMVRADKTMPRTKNEIFDGMKKAEERFSKERWSGEDQSDFYNISKDIASIAPSLFSSYFEVFEKLNPKNFQLFAQEVFPLHRVVLVLAEKSEYGKRSHNKKDLANIRKRFVESVVDQNGDIKSIAEQTKELVDEITETFKNKFGITKIPEKFNQEQIRSLNNISLYLSNIQGRNEEKENILGFYLALMINNKWDDFRRGEEIKPEEFLEEGNASTIRRLLNERAELNPLTADNLGISAEKMPEFYKTLESDTENITTGNIETVDTKLNNVILNLDGLRDLDLYPDPLDKGRMELLLRAGNKKLGSVTAKLYQKLANPEKAPDFSAEDQEIANQIETMLKENSLEVTAKNIKKYFQEEIKPFSVTMNILNFIEEIGAEKEISELREILRPSPEIISIFNKLGEGFKSSSGAIALSQDLDHLENLVIKNEDELIPEESSLVKSYLNSIREKIVKLESIHDQVVKKFSGLKQGQTTTKNDLLKNKLEDIDKIIGAKDSQKVITSGMTTNLNYIIENMRECLSCVRQGCNNDTDLTFGDQNKFYLYSKTESASKSISDEIVFLEPITNPDGTSEMSFVLDRVYGTNTPAILVNQVETVLKKYREIKRKFPEAKISLFVSQSALASCGLTAESLIEKLANPENITTQVQTAEVNVIKSAVADHYVEFASEARTAGKKSAGGVSIR